MELPRTQTVILAGGQGERLHPLTVSRPKPAVSFGGIFRLIDFTLSNCLNSGLSQVSLLTQYRYEDLHRYVRQYWSDRTSVLCLPPSSGKRYRGTADAVFKNMELLEEASAEFTLVLSGDHIYSMDYRELLLQHAATNADLTIATVEYPRSDASQFGVVEVDTDFKVTGFEEKPAYPRPMPAQPSMALVSMGVYVFKTKALLQALRDHCEEGQGYDFGHHIIPSFINAGRTFAFDFRNDTERSPRYWRDIGTIDGYYEASMDLLRPDRPFDPYRNVTRPATLSTRLHSRSHISGSVLSPGICVEEGAVVEDSVLMPGVRIGKGARLRRAIVEEGVQIPAGFHAGFDLDRDRQHHTVSYSGVVVVNETPANIKPTVLRFALRKRNICAGQAAQASAAWR